MLNYRKGEAVIKKNEYIKITYDDSVKTYNKSTNGKYLEIHFKSIYHCTVICIVFLWICLGNEIILNTKPQFKLPFYQNQWFYPSAAVSFWFKAKR